MTAIQRSDSPVSTTRRSKRRFAPLAVVLIAAFALAGCATITPSANVNPAGEPLRAQGLGFANTLPVGVYVAFGPDPKTLPADWFTRIELFQAAVWVNPNGTGTATNKKMTADGTFDFNLTRADGSPITAVYTNGLGKVVNCKVVQCGIIVMKAHGSTDRSWDRFSPVTFR